MKPDWILIANASNARLLQQERGRPLTVLKHFEHGDSRAKASELAGDSAGAEKSDRGFGRAALQPRMDPKQKEHLRFARELAAHLDQAARQGGFRSLSIFASSPFLGDIKAEIGVPTQRLLLSTHDLDLTSFGLNELEQRVERALAH